MNAITALLLVLCVVSTTNARVWSPEYIKALLETRQCYNERHLEVLDSFFTYLNDTTLGDHFQARVMTTLSDRLDRTSSLCEAIEATGSHMFKELTWHKKQDTRRMKEKKILPIHHSGREATINHLRYALSEGIVRNACEAITPLSKEEMAALQTCTRDKRKESMYAYTKFTE